MIEKSIKYFKETNWDFENSVSKRIHRIHPYPAKFIPQIPEKLIEIFHPGDDSIVLDPFCGSGTTLVEARNQGIDSVGVDLNPLACLIAKVKTNSIPHGVAEIKNKVVKNAHRTINENRVYIPDIPRLDHWFKPDIQIGLAALIGEINKENHHAFKDVLNVAFSSIIVRVSNQESNTRYAAIDKQVCQEDIFVYFERAVDQIQTAIFENSANLFNKLGDSQIINGNIIDMKDKIIPKNVGLVITSPPYPNAYEYWLYHKYRMYWLGMDPIYVREREIGARPHYSKTNGQTEVDFERQMTKVFENLSRVVNERSIICFLVGRSIIKGRTINNVKLLKNAGESQGFQLQEVAERKIPSNRKSFNPTHGRINKEHIMVFSFGELN